jgi:hypothetical protein
MVELLYAQTNTRAAGRFKALMQWPGPLWPIRSKSLRSLGIASIRVRWANTKKPRHAARIIVCDISSEVVFDAVLEPNQPAPLLEGIDIVFRQDLPSNGTLTGQHSSNATAKSSSS